MAAPMTVSALHDLTGIDRRTITARLEALTPKKQGKRQVYRPREALPLLFGQDRKYSAGEERARKDSMGADKLEIEVQTLRGELVDRLDVFHAWESMLVAIRDRLLSMPPRVVPLLQATDGKFGSMLKVLDDGVRDALTAASNFRSDEIETDS